jgi:hypothetical protein
MRGIEAGPTVVDPGEVVSHQRLHASGVLGGVVRFCTRRLPYPLKLDGLRKVEAALAQKLASGVNLYNPILENSNGRSS